MQWLHNLQSIFKNPLVYKSNTQSPLQENHKTTLPNHSIVMLWFQLFMESGEKHIHHLSFTNKKIGKSAKKDISMNEQKRYNLDFWKFQLFYLSNKEILRYEKKK